MSVHQLQSFSQVRQTASIRNPFYTGDGFTAKPKGHSIHGFSTQTIRKTLNLDNHHCHCGINSPFECTATAERMPSRWMTISFCQFSSQGVDASSSSLYRLSVFLSPFQAKVFINIFSIQPDSKTPNTVALRGWTNCLCTLKQIWVLERDFKGTIYTNEHMNVCLNCGSTSQTPFSLWAPVSPSSCFRLTGFSFKSPDSDNFPLNPFRGAPRLTP